jgi:hypothetical protein
MLLFVATFLAAASGQPAGDMPTVNPNAGQPANCPATSRYEASRRGKTPKAQTLTELPDADTYKAVYRRIGRCEVPIIVKYGARGR